MLPEKFVESRICLIIIDLEFMILVKLRLPQDFVCHRPKIICECLDYLWILVILETPQVSHINEHEIIELDPEMTALLDEHREARLLQR